MSCKTLLTTAAVLAFLIPGQALASRSYSTTTSIRNHYYIHIHHKQHYRHYAHRHRKFARHHRKEPEITVRNFPLIEVNEDGWENDPWAMMMGVFDLELITARQYLIKTATPGATMSRQGVDVAIGRLEPHFAKRLAAAIRASRAEGIRAGVYSAYRPPAYGVGGFRNKSDSMHAYGLAVDMTGIGGPGSKTAIRWARIAAEYGVYMPYGVYNHAEYNHAQPVFVKIAPSILRPTITARAPKSKVVMWSAAAKYIAKPGLPAIIRVATRTRRSRHRSA